MADPKPTETNESQASQNFVDLAKKLFKVPSSEIKQPAKPKPSSGS